jgi:hypothetical protein
MNREALLELAERVEGNSWVIRRFLHDPTIEDHMVALEVLGRCNIIEAKVAQIRAEMAREAEQIIRENAPKPNVHTLGAREPSYRPSGSDAA